LYITARAASNNETIHVDDEADELPEGVKVFDSTDWSCPVFMALAPGDWVIEIKDPQHLLDHQILGLFHVHMSADHDCGQYKKIK
jgi:hypothetical protein